MCKACDENAKKRKCFGCGDLHEKGAYSSKEWIKADLLCRACDENLEKKCFGCGDLQEKGAYHWEEWRKRAPRCIAWMRTWRRSASGVALCRGRAHTIGRSGESAPRDA